MLNLWGELWGKLWGSIMGGIMHDFVLLRHHHNVKSKKKRLLCHNAVLCVHYACICLNWLHSYICILHGNMATLVLIRLQFDSFHSFERKDRMKKLNVKTKSDSTTTLVSR